MASPEQTDESLKELARLLEEQATSIESSSMILFSAIEQLQANQQRLQKLIYAELGLETKYSQVRNSFPS